MTNVTISKVLLMTVCPFTLDLNKLIMTEGLVCPQEDQALSRRLFVAHGRRDNFFKMTDGGFYSQMPFLFVLGLPQGTPFPCSPASCFDNVQTSQMSGILPTETQSLRHGRMNSKSSLFSVETMWNWWQKQALVLVQEMTFQSQIQITKM